jgi:hypothetical protein
VAGDSPIKITDQWADGGTLLLEEGDWTAEFREGAKQILLSAEGNQIRIALGTMALSSSQILEKGETSTVVVSIGLRSGQRIAQAKLSFQADGSLKIAPEIGMNRLTVSGEIRYGVLPGLYLEDIIFSPDDYSMNQTLHLPSESLFWLLLGDESGILVFAWPEGQQKIKLVKQGASFHRFEILADNKPIYLKLLAAPGIWHKEKLKLNYLEKDVQLGWRRPFDAQWKTQLLVSKVPTAWLFDRQSVRMWIPMLGFFRYPVWFDGPATMLRLSKKIPPKGDCFIYPLDGHPKTPFGFAKQTPVGKILKERQKRLRIDKEHSDRLPNVGYVHCWGTSILQRTIYKNGLQAREKEFLSEHANYCVDYVNRIQRQSLGYYAFILEMKRQLDLWVGEVPKDSEELAYLRQMQSELAKVEKMYHSRVERGGRKTPEEHMEYAADLGRRLKELIQDPGRESFPEAKFILDNFNALSAATDEDVPAGFGITIRRMFQEAATACANRPDAVKYAEEIRRRIWQKTKTRNYETTGL